LPIKEFIPFWHSFALPPRGCEQVWTTDFLTSFALCRMAVEQELEDD
jgi:hypothetical protein